MSISPKREYDPGTQSMIGLPTLPAGENLVKKREKEGIDIGTVLATNQCLFGWPCPQLEATGGLSL